MNITLTGNNDRQNDKAMAMVGHAPKGAKIYEVYIVNGLTLSPSKLDTWRCEGGRCLHHHSRCGIFVICVEAMSLEQAKEHADEVMASYLED